MNAVRPYRLYGESQISRVQTRIDQIVNDWLGCWFCEREQPVASQLNVDQVSRSDKSVTCVRINCIEGNWCAIAMDAEFVRKLPVAMFNAQSFQISEFHTGVMSEVIEKALADLGSRIVEGSGGADIRLAKVDMDVLPRDVFAMGSGCLAFGMTLDGVETRVFLSRQLVDCYLKTASNSRTNDGAEAARSNAVTLVPPQQALGKQRVHATVRLGDADLALSTLATLQVGDVIKLDTRIVEHSELLFADSNTKCLGYLGRTGDKYALRIDTISEIQR